MKALKTRGAVAVGVLLLAGFGGGATAMVVGSASAEDAGATSSTSADEDAMTGDTLAKITTAVRGRYPDAAIEDAETESDGTYEAHITTADDQELSVELDTSFAITDTETHDGHGHGRGHGPGPGPDGNRADDTALSGDTLAKVTAAVEAEYPGATVEEAETDSDGAYEAHITTADEQELSVEVDKSFAITGTETHDGHGHGRGGADEVALTGDTLAKVTAAVEAEYPGATIERAETDSDGVYEAHITTADDEELTVEVDKGFAVTGTETSP